jgi:hypothetical protein
MSPFQNLVQWLGFDGFGPALNLANYPTTRHIIFNYFLGWKRYIRSNHMLRLILPFCHYLLLT